MCLPCLSGGGWGGEGGWGWGGGVGGSGAGVAGGLYPSPDLTVRGHSSVT